jgi:hypothetical protein
VKVLVEKKDNKIRIVVEVCDPLVAGLIKDLARRSNEGALEYGHSSLLDRVDDPLVLVKDALEESFDQLIYVGGALHLLSEARRIERDSAEAEESEEDADIIRWVSKIG